MNTALRSPKTKEIYSRHRKYFLKFVGRKSIDEYDNDDAAKATQEITQYLKKLKSDGLSFSHRNIALAAVKHDFIMNDRPVLNWIKIAKFLGENERKYEIRDTHMTKLGEW